MKEYLDFTLKGNTRRKILAEEVLNQEHNLLCYSKDFAMTEYKDGYKYEWKDAQEKLQLFKQLLNEQPNENGICYYYGELKNWYCTDEEAGFSFVEMYITNPACLNKNETPIYFFKIPSKIFMEWKKNYFKEKKQRQEKELPDVVRVEVKFGKIFDIVWVDSWE